MAVYSADVIHSTYLANADLTAKQFFCVSCGLVAGEVKAATTASNPGVFGILQNDPTTGEEALVAHFGVVKAAVYGAINDGTATDIAYGDMLICGSDGRLHVQTTASSICNAIALNTCTSALTGVISVLLMPGIGVHTAADNVA